MSHGLEKELKKALKKGLKDAWGCLFWRLGVPLGNNFARLAGCWGKLYKAT